ncbi:hypothetical protein L1987_12694 [Smallanthus sonchifolius]|uniref:Uncharacterized protein n=1 Tax=Smallanthus sonchifolius TaxID=185202 RepID=A0ACB9JEG6_9ASTR|nr:hypothetical protein L1987_12694 [Smallanthus sonchifolius]
MSVCDFLFFQGFTSKKDRRHFLCCPPSPICFRTLFFQFTLGQFFGGICGFVSLLVIGSRILSHKQLDG